MNQYSQNNPTMSTQTCFFCVCIYNIYKQQWWIRHPSIPATVLVNLLPWVSDNNQHPPATKAQHNPVTTHLLKSAGNRQVEKYNKHTCMTAEQESDVLLFGINSHSVLFWCHIGVIPLNTKTDPNSRAGVLSYAKAPCMHSWCLMY